MRLFSERKKTTVGILLFCQVGAYIATYSYINTIILRKYSFDSLSIYYSADYIFTATVVFFGILISSKYSRKFLNIISFSAALITPFVFFLNDSQIANSAIYSCVLLAGMSDLVEVSLAAFIFLAFDIRSLHKVTRWTTLVAVGSLIFFTIAIPTFISAAGSRFIPFLLSFLYLICFITARSYKSLPQPRVSKQAEAKNPIEYPVFRLFVFYTFIVSTCWLLLDYTFKISLYKMLSLEQAGIVTSISVGGASLLAAIALNLNSQKFANKFGSLNLVSYYAILVSISALSIAFFPILAVIFLARLFAKTFNEGFAVFGRQTLLNATPRQIHVHVRSYIFAIPTLFAGLIGPGILRLIGGSNATPTTVAFIVAVLALFALIPLALIKKRYPASVKGTVENPRFLSFRSEISYNDIDTNDFHQVVPEIGHRFSAKDALLFLRNAKEDPIPILMDGLDKTKDVANFEARVSVLGNLPQEKSELALSQLLDVELAILPNGIPKAMALRSLSGLGEPLRKMILKKFAREAKLISELKASMRVDTPPHLLKELESRLALALHRFYFYFAALANTRAILNAMPQIIANQLAQIDTFNSSDALEYLEFITKDSKLRMLFIGVADLESNDITLAEYDQLILADPWLSKVRTLITFFPGANMNVIEKALFLRRVKLFDALPAEILEFIAESLVEDEIKAHTTIFSKGEEGEKIYLVVSGEISIQEGTMQIRQVHPYGMFGEIALLGNSLRTATAITKTDTVLLTLQRQEFIQMIGDVPELSLAIIKQLIGYLQTQEPLAANNRTD